VAKTADEAGEERTILFNLSGHGHFDMAAYDNYFAGKLEDVALDEDEMSRALHAIEGLPSPASRSSGTYPPGPERQQHRSSDLQAKFALWVWSVKNPVRRVDGHRRSSRHIGECNPTGGPFLWWEARTTSRRPKAHFVQFASKSSKRSVGRVGVERIRPKCPAKPHGSVLFYYGGFGGTWHQARLPRAALWGRRARRGARSARGRAGNRQGDQLNPIKVAPG
jgi:hypothetical protein